MPREFITTRNIVRTFTDQGLVQALANMRTFLPSGSIRPAICAAVIRTEIARRTLVPRHNATSQASPRQITP